MPRTDSLGIPRTAKCRGRTPSKSCERQNAVPSLPETSNSARCLIPPSTRCRIRHRHRNTDSTRRTSDKSSCIRSPSRFMVIRLHPQHGDAIPKQNIRNRSEGVFNRRVDFCVVVGTFVRQGQEKFVRVFKRGTRGK